MFEVLLAAANANWVATILDTFGAAAVFVFVLVENFGLPIPGETMIVLAAAYATSAPKTGGQHTNIYLVGVASVAGIWLGCSASYFLGKRRGRGVMSRLHVPDKHLDRAQKYIDRWGIQTVIFGRFVAFLRSYIGWLAGINQMRTGPFLLCNLIGAVAWTLVFTIIGIVIGDNIAVIERTISTIGYVGVGAVVVGVVALILYRKARARNS